MPRKYSLCFVLYAIVAYLPSFLLGRVFDEAQQGNIKICLAMMVKNDDSVIKHCLNSVKDIVDYICICDTGSDDYTLHIVEQFLQESDIPGIIVAHSWNNFGYNTTRSVKAAQEMLQAFGAPLEKTYLLIFNANEILSIDEEFQKEALDKDSYSMLEKSSTLGYSKYTPHLLRASIPWESVGIVHENWVDRGVRDHAKLKTLIIVENEEDKQKEGNLHRNIELLTLGLQSELNNERYTFYLAQSHKALAHYEEAIHWYKMRINQGGNQEEVWFSKYMLGECYGKLGQWDHALYWYLEAYQYDPNRVEPLWKVATQYREYGQNDLAYIFAKHGTRIFPSFEYSLFPLNSLDAYAFDQELSISAYYTRFKEEGFQAASDLTLRKNVPWYILEHTYRNMLFYVQKLPNAPSDSYPL